MPAPSMPPCMVAVGEVQKPPPLVFNQLCHPQCLRIQHQEWGERVPLALLKQPLRFHPHQAQDHLRALVRLSLWQGNIHIRRNLDNLMLIGNLAVCQCIHPDNCPIPQYGQRIFISAASNDDSISNVSRGHTYLPISPIAYIFFHIWVFI